MDGGRVEREMYFYSDNLSTPTIHQQLYTQIASTWIVFQATLLKSLQSELDEKDKAHDLWQKLVSDCTTAQARYHKRNQEIEINMAEVSTEFLIYLSPSLFTSFLPPSPHIFLLLKTKQKIQVG